LIDPVTMMGGHAAAGAILGIISNIISGNAKKQIELEKIRHKYNEQTSEYQVKISNTKPPFYFPILLLTTTYCIAVTICFICGDIPIASQGFSTEPTETSIALGLFKRTSPNDQVYLLTFAGLGTYFMSPIAFILTSVFTGIVPKRGA